MDMVKLRLIPEGQSPMAEINPETNKPMSKKVKGKEVPIVKAGWKESPNNFICNGQQIVLDELAMEIEKQKPEICSKENKPFMDAAVEYLNRSQFRDWWDIFLHGLAATNEINSKAEAGMYETLKAVFPDEETAKKACSTFCTTDDGVLRCQPLNASLFAAWDEQPHRGVGIPPTLAFGGVTKEDLSDMGFQNLSDKEKAEAVKKMSEEKKVTTRLKAGDFICNSICSSTENGIDCSKSQELLSAIDGCDKDWLVKNTRGLSYKGADMLLLLAGCKNTPVVDTHIVNFVDNLLCNDYSRWRREHYTLRVDPETGEINNKSSYKNYYARVRSSEFLYNQYSDIMKWFAELLGMNTSLYHVYQWFKTVYDPNRKEFGGDMNKSTQALNNWLNLVLPNIPQKKEIGGFSIYSPNPFMREPFKNICEFKVEE